MDPPHNSLFDILYRPARESRIAPWLLVYQGHASQVGRAMAAENALARRYRRVKLWQIGPEVITIAGPESWCGRDFGEVIERAEDLVRREANEYAWALESRIAWANGTV
jgi:hypothetical protein